MSEYTITMRNILEIRLKEKQFSFIDYRGKFIDFLVKEYKGKKIKYLNNNSRIDVATEDEKEVVFFGVENFGFQIEAINSFEEFKEQVEKIFKIIDKFNYYEFNNVARIGVKSFIYCHKRTKGFEYINNMYRDRMFKDSSFYETISTSKLVDFGYSFNDVEINDSKANIITGPMNKGEALSRWFYEYPEYYKDTEKAGFIYIIDCFQDSVKEGLSVEAIKNIAIDNINNAQKSFNGFKGFIFEKENESKK